MKIWTDLLNNFQENIPNSVECELKMMHSKSALTRFANSQIHQNVDEESADVYLTVHKAVSYSHLTLPTNREV